MSASTITTIVALVIALLGTVVIPSQMAKRQKAKEDQTESAVTFTSLNNALDKFNKELVAKLKQADEDHKRDLADLERRYKMSLSAADKRIAELEAEVESLRRRLNARRTPKPSDG